MKFKSNLKASVGFLLILGLVSCSHSSCRRQKDDISSERVIAPEEAYRTVSKETKEHKVWVYKYDGSLQCGGGEVRALEDMEKELAGLKIFSSEKRSDTLLRAQMCGAFTGIANRYEILADDLPKAEKRGFKLWQF